jgi:hypothetical protein
LKILSFNLAEKKLFFAMGNQKIQNCRHSVQKAVDLTTPAKNRAKNWGVQKLF